MNREEVKFDHFKDIQELIQHLEMWYAEDDYFAYDRYFHLRDARIMGMFIYELQQEKQQLKEKYEELQEAFKKAITTEHHKIHALLDIIDEVKTAVDYMIGNADISEIHGTKLKQILDKIKEN